MKILKFILISVYPILILLLLLNNLGNKRHIPEIVDPPLENEEDSEEVVDSEEAVRHAESVGNGGDLKVTLLWDFEGDIDLHVTQPNGAEIYFMNKSDSITGGYLDTDNQDGGHDAAENIYWKEPPKGEYLVDLVYFQASKVTNTAEPGTCTVVVFQEGKSPCTYLVRMEAVQERNHVTNIYVE